MRSIRRASALLLAVGCAGGSAGPASGPALVASLVGTTGQPVGTATLTETGDGVSVRFQLSGLAPGAHGAHIHAVGKCDPPGFTTAGGHLNTTGKQHGHKNPAGWHLGDVGPCEPVQGFKLWSIADSITDAGVTLFKVENLPDCRYNPAACRAALDLPDPPECGGVAEPICSAYTADLTSDDIGDGKVIYDPDGTGYAAAQFLNVTPLLDEDITSLYDDTGVPPGGLPPLLFSPYFRGQAESLYLFEAFFVKPEPGLTFTGNFEGEFDVAELAGRENGCIFRARLASQGYEILTASDGEKALATARNALPDLILLDIMMPKMAGIEV